MEVVRAHLFGRAPPEVGVGADFGALPNTEPEMDSGAETGRKGTGASCRRGTHQEAELASMPAVTCATIRRSSTTMP